MSTDQVVREGRAEGDDAEQVVFHPSEARACAFNQAHCGGSAGGETWKRTDTLIGMTDMFMSGALPLSHGQYPSCLGCQIVSVFYFLSHDQA